MMQAADHTDTHNNNISIRNARVNNLKGVSLEIPRGKLVVITGVSGSGKSSLAFDTLYAEGQRRYVESLSAYARQFLGKMAKPEVDFIRGLPPAIAIEQKVNTRNPRSTVGTSTEIYDYLRLMFGRIGHTISPVSGEEVKKHSVEDVIAAARAYPERTRIAIVSPIVPAEGRDFKAQLEIYLSEGYSRLYSQGTFTDIGGLLADGGKLSTVTPDDYRLLIDRLAVAYEGDELSRLADSAETAMFEGDGSCELVVWPGGGAQEYEVHRFSNKFEADGITFVEPTDQLFNFNNPFGACPRCEGFGRAIGIDAALVIPNTARSVYDDAVNCWRGEKMNEWKRRFITQASRHGFPVHTPYCELTQEQLDLLWHGAEDVNGIDDFFKMVDENSYKIQYRVLKARYTGKTTCPTCHGSRLRAEVQYIKVGGKTISQLVTMPVSELAEWFGKLTLDERDAAVAKRLLAEINRRLRFLIEVGLGYLTLDRLSNSLSGGESQRINLATSLGSSLVGSIYILDEPSIGLHSRDTERLIGVLRELQQLGNTVVVVEHDEDIIRAADHIIDVGPLAGTLGGEIVFAGPASELLNDSRSLTSQYITGVKKIAVPTSRRKPSGYVTVKGARANNLKNIDVRFPLGVMTCVTGVSGSGKSTLVRDILYRAMSLRLEKPTDAPGAHDSLTGDLSAVSDIEFVDQNPIGKSSRSNPATYLKAYDEIRYLFAEQQSAKQMGFTPAFFSFNTDGGRCDECKGEGTITIEMQFMADITIPCESCHGQRFKHDVLQITYRGVNISDVLNMTVDKAIAFFGEDKSAAAQRVVRRLQPLQDVGLGYITLGQSSSTLSGGENQRVKLAYYLAQPAPRPTMFIFDEPTTGLHFNDINTLLKSFDRLIAQGHTIIIIEHNMDVIKTADHIIDIGPEGGAEGGTIVVEGTPEQVAASGLGYTSVYLASKLKG